MLDYIIIEEIKKREIQSDIQPEELPLIKDDEQIEGIEVAKEPSNRGVVVIEYY